MSIDRILSELLSSPARAGLAGAVAGGLLTSKAGRKLGKRAAELGGIAAIAGLAYTAWRRYEARVAAPTGGAPGLDAVREPTVLETAGFLPPAQQEAVGEPLGRLLLRAMIAAARADGKLDGEERRRLFGRIARLDLGDAERADLYAELEKPMTPEQLADAVVGPAQATEVYAASLLATEVDTPAERAYLSLLAGRLGLEDELVASLHREAGVPAPGEAGIGLRPAPSKESRMLEPGKPFPAFSLPNQDGVSMSLADFKGRWLVVYTYPKDDTPGCTLEGKGFSASKPAYDAIGAVVVGLSADDVKSHKSFCDKFAFTVPLLADTRAQLLKALGVGQSEFKGTKYWDRVTFLVDPKGVVRKVYPKVKPDGHDQEVLRDLRELQKQA